MTDLSFLAVLRNESCMFCAGLLSIGHSLLQIEQPENQKHRTQYKSGTGETLSGGGKTRHPDRTIRYGLRRAISTWMQLWGAEFSANCFASPFQCQPGQKEGEPE